MARMQASSTADTVGARLMARKRSMPRISSMLFDLELEEGAPLTPQDSGDVPLPPAAQLHGLLQPRTQAESDLVHAVAAAYAAAAAAGRQMGVPELADNLRSLGYTMRVRTALGGASGGAGGGIDGECLRNLRHQFLTIPLQGTGLGSRTEAIVDPHFAEQFAVARPTPRYASVLEALPDAYVGTDIQPVVEFLCGELAAAFKESGATLPPWRDTAALLSKWQPRRSIDMDWTSVGHGTVPEGLQQPQQQLVNHHLGSAIEPSLKPSPSPRAARGASEVTADTNGPRPSKSQRVGVAAAAAAAASVLHGVGTRRPPLMPPASPAQPIAARVPVPYSPLASRAFRPAGAPAGTFDAPEPMNPDLCGFDRPVRRISCHGSSPSPLTEAILKPSADAAPEGGSPVRRNSGKGGGGGGSLGGSPIRKISDDRTSLVSQASDVSELTGTQQGGNTKGATFKRHSASATNESGPSWLCSGSWRTSDCIPFPKASSRTLSDTVAIVSGGQTSGPSSGLGSGSSDSAAASLPIMRSWLDGEVSSLTARSLDRRAEAGSLRDGYPPAAKYVAAAAGAVPPLPLPAVPAAAMSGGNFASPFVRAAAAAARHSSPFAAVSTKPPAGDLRINDPFEGTTRRGKPRALAALSASAAVQPAPPLGLQETTRKLSASSLVAAASATSRRSLPFHQSSGGLSNAMHVGSPAVGRGWAGPPALRSLNARA